MKLLFKRTSDSLLSYTEVYDKVSKDRIGTLVKSLGSWCYRNLDNKVVIEGKNRVGTERLVKSFYK